MKFGDRVKFILLFRRISQRNFSKQINISESQLSKLLNNKKNPSTRELEKIIEILNVPYECLVGKIEIFDDLLKYFYSFNSLWL